MAPTVREARGDELPDVRVPPPGPRSCALADRLAEVESPAFGARRASRAAAAGGVDPRPIVYGSARGANVVDVDGNVYVDLAAGFGALLLGHCPPAIDAALRRQAGTLWLALGDLYGSEAKLALTERLAALAPFAGARVLLGQSGADAIGVAQKTARLATGRPGVLAFRGAYHGLSYGPLAALGLRASWREAFADQLNPHAAFAAYPGLDGATAERALDEARAALAGGEVGAVLVEPILGRGGVVTPPPGFLASLVAEAHAAGALVVADEIWTGLGRSGAMFAACEAGAVPDLVCLGKGLGGGLPLSACLGRPEVMAAWAREPSREVVHTATFHGAPLACATALALLDALEQGALVERSRAVGAAAREALTRALAGRDDVTAVRGAGLMTGVALARPGGAVALHAALLARGFLTTVGGLAGEVLVLTPPLDIPEALLDAFARALPSALDAVRDG